MAVVSALTLSRIPFALIFAVSYLCLHSAFSRMATGLIILVFIETSDIVDGWLARRWRVVTEWGSAMDPYADSVSRLLVFWTLAVAGMALPIVPLVMAVRDVTVAYCRIVMARNRTTVAARLSGKAKAVIQGTAAFLLVGSPIYQKFTGSWTNSAVSWFVIVITVVSAADYIRAARSSVR